MSKKSLLSRDGMGSKEHAEASRIYLSSSNTKALPFLTVIRLELSRRATSRDRFIPSALALNMSCSPLTSELAMKCSRSSNPSLLSSAALDEGCDLVGRESVLHLRSSSVASLIMPLEMSSHPLFSQFLKARTCEEGCSPNFGLVYSPANSYYTAFWLCLYSVALLLSALRIIKTLNLI